MIAALLLAAAVAAPKANACGLCHPDVRVEFEQGVHRREGITCASCHGGDPAATTVAGAHRGAFRGVPRRRDIPALCASCHADVARMRPYNLPSDQLALYQTSRHGRLLQQGDERVAVCTDCHGAHAIRRRDDPKSPIFPRNVPATCGRCHGDAALMARYGKKDDPYADYVAGVHGQALLQQGNDSAPECARCHGAHGATPPGVGDVDKVCGQCHAATRAYFEEGPHRDAMVAAGEPECASCHGNHRIARADLSLLDTACLRCHGTDSDAERLAGTMKTLVTAATEEVDRARGLVDAAAAVPLYVEDYRARLEEARTASLEALPVIHALSVARVEELTQRSRSIAREVASEIGGKIDGLRWRRAGLLVFWFYLLLTIAILVRSRRRAERGAPR